MTASRWRALSREISRIANAEVAEILDSTAAVQPLGGYRICMTGPPGVGKSTLVGKLVERRAANGTTVAVIAIDPASPFSGGAILGDRIRMPAAAESDAVYMRSLSSRKDELGVCTNLADVLAAVDAEGFDEIVLETVGLGQTGFSARALVDTLVLLLQPATGDAVQAMKSGIVEVADIVAITKSDIPGAELAQRDVASVLARARARSRHEGWAVPVIGLSATRGDGLADLQAAIERHRDWWEHTRDTETVIAERGRYRMRELIVRALNDAIESVTPPASARDYCQRVLERLASDGAF